MEGPCEYRVCVCVYMWYMSTLQVVKISRGQKTLPAF